MSFRKYFFIIVVILSLAPVLMGDIIYSDNFDSNLNNWIRYDNTGLYTGTPHNGVSSVEVKKVGSIERTISTAGYSGITVKFYLGASSLDTSDENMQALWFDGSTWRVMKQIDDGAPEENKQLHFFQVSLSSGAANNPSFAVKFKINASGTGDYGYVDDLVVEGFGPTPAPTDPTVLPAPPDLLPSPWDSQDIGATGASGYTAYNNGSFTIDGSGADIWGTADEFHYVYQSFSGDGVIIAKVLSIQNTNSWAKAGVMIRENLTPGSKHAGLFITPGNSASFQYRSSSNGTSLSMSMSGQAPYWVKLARVGNFFTAYTSSNGTSWTQSSAVSIPMASSVYFGLVVTSHNDGTLCRSVIGNVSIEVSSPPPTATPVAPPPTTPPPPPGNGSYIWLEAENSAAFYPEVVKSDSYNDQTPSDSASNEIFLGVAGWGSATGNPPTDGHMIFNLSKLNLSGVYKIWARAKGPWYGSVKFWNRLGSGTWNKWERIEYGQWIWGVVSQADLTGVASFTMAYCENRAMLDKILITNDLNYTPSGIGGAEIIDKTPNLTSTNAVATYRDLKVVGRNLCDEWGHPVQLRGVCTHGLQWFPLVKDRTIGDLVETFPFNSSNGSGLSIIRLAMYVEDFWTSDDFWNGYLADRAGRLKVVEDLVEDAIDAGVYVVVDWHIHQNPVTTKYNNSYQPGPGSRFSAGLPAAAEDFFKYMAQKYGSYDNVIFELCSEPVDASWENDIKPYAEKIIPVIRQYSDNIIIVGVPNWSQYVDAPIGKQITGFGNIMYALHFYAASHDHIMPKVQEAIDAGLPLIVTEWGTSDYAASYNDLQRAQKWFDEFINKYNLSWTNWSMAPKDEASSIIVPGTYMSGTWSNSDFTDSGKWVRDRMME